MNTGSSSTLRGENAKMQLLLTAADVYGEQGLDGATTRKIAQASGQNIAAISYYFGSKEGLYLAVAQLIAKTIRDDFHDVFQAIDNFLNQPLSVQVTDDALDLLQKTVIAYNHFQLEKKI